MENVNGTLENIDVDGTPFSVLMERAVKLKMLHTKHTREQHDARPSFYANSMFPREEVVAARELSFDERLAAATRMKEEGNAAFREGRLSDALAKYEMALSVFRFLENTNPSWKSEGIKDAYIKEHCYVGESEEECQQLNQFLVNCYNNVALVSHKMANFSLATQACDYALFIEENDKSFYLRAKARITPKSSGAVELSLAKSDLQAALKCNSQNKEARKLLQKLSGQLRVQKQKDKRTFKGLFDRGEVYDAQELVEEKEARKVEAEQEQVDSKARDLVVGKQLVQLYEERGMEQEKQQLEQSLRHEERRAVDRNAYLRSLDFRNASAEMIQDAKTHGVDLTDPQTILLLEAMQKESKTSPPRPQPGVPADRGGVSSNDNKVKVLSYELVPKGKGGRRCLSIVAGIFLVGCCYLFLFTLLRAKAMQARTI